MATALSIKDLTVEFTTPAGVVRAVDGVSYDVAAGETLGVVGETGSGKSVTVLAALGLLSASNIRRISGQALLDGVDMLAKPDAELRRMLGRDVAMIFQDPISALNPVQRVGDQIAETLRVHDRSLSARAARARVVELLELVGVPNPDGRCDAYPHQFSGGMCQRAVIATAIANQPKVLIADEPTTALDVSVQAQILDVLRVAAEETGAATVLITHDLGVVAETADRVCVMYGGRVVETGAIHPIFARPQHPYTAALLASLPRLDVAADQLAPIPGQPPDLIQLPQGCGFAPRCAVGKDRAQCTEHKPPLLALEKGSSACHFPELAKGSKEHSPELAKGSKEHGPELAKGIEKHSPDEAAVFPRADDSASAAPRETSVTQDGVAVLDVREAEKRFPIRTGVFARASGWVHAVDRVSLEIKPGRTLGLVGESGCGKSTLARMLLRLIDASGGDITIAGSDLVGAGRSELRRIRRQVQMVYQDPFASLNPRLSVGDNVAEPLRLAGGFSRPERRARVRDLFDRVGLRPEHVDRFPAEFSGGQRQRVAIARALALRPRLLILDEPVSALDVSVQAQVLNLLSDLQRESGMAYLFVSHDLSVVRQVADEVAVMYLGRIAETGDVDSIYERSRHPYTRALLASVPIPDPVGRESRKRAPLGGDVPSPADPPSGCRFRTRCPMAETRCAEEEPVLRTVDGVLTACHLAERLVDDPEQAVRL
ncbi:MAG: dipeptide ABC transporter ATP-binding protein [Stackebrandtia sp.]